MFKKIVGGVLTTGILFSGSVGVFAADNSQQLPTSKLVKKEACPNNTVCYRIKEFQYYNLPVKYNKNTGSNEYYYKLSGETGHWEVDSHKGRLTNLSAGKIKVKVYEGGVLLKEFMVIADSYN
ncbi:hypothetical protein [Bacillus cereus]|uniref:hypothetical protein n=1 Tax=Bacillus cereus TaxID=1396 RepID=UPI000FE2F04F|nr:hypothetical protein [Bacillus cereus]MDA2645017.1 hypothetical protein [Bacillus cereus]RWR54313.1 hypothetical protein DYR28_28390 [Bacillus cereus]